MAQKVRGRNSIAQNTKAPQTKEEKPKCKMENKRRIPPTTQLINKLKKNKKAFP